MFKTIRIAILLQSLYPIVSTIWEQFKEYKRSQNEHEIKQLTLRSNAEMVNTILKDYVQGSHLIDVKTDTMHIQINQI